MRTALPYDFTFCEARMDDCPFSGRCLRRDRPEGFNLWVKDFSNGRPVEGECPFFIRRPTRQEMEDYER